MSADSAVLPLSTRLMRYLRVESDEVRPTLLLALFLLLGMAAVICLKAVSDAVFLSEFNATRLPYVDLAVTVLVGLLVNFYLRWSRHLPLGALVARTQTALAASIIALWLLLSVDVMGSPILLYLWVGIFAILIPSQVWSLSAATFTTRQAKRVFTVIGAGGIVGAAVGGSFTGFAGPLIGAANVLPVAAALLLGGAWIARTITHGKQDAPAAREASAEKAPLLGSGRLVCTHRYLLLIALAIIASTVVGTLVKYQFKAVAQIYFESDRDGLASFAGYFYGYVSVLSFIFHTTLSNRILRWIGPSFALFVLPLAMLTGVVGLFFSASILAAVWARGADQGFRHSIDRAATELLWVPVANDLRNRVKSFMDVVVSRGADGLASLTLLALLYFEGTSIHHISWASVVFLAGWLLILWTLRGEYIQTLRTTIERPDISAEQLLQRLAASEPSIELEMGLASADPHDVEVAVGLAQFSRADAAQTQLASLLLHDSQAVRRKAMATISSINAPGCSQQVAEYIRIEDNFDYLLRALDYLDSHDPAFAQETEEAMLAEPDVLRKALAATRLMRIPGHSADVAEPFHDAVVAFGDGDVEDQVRAAQLLREASIGHAASVLLSRLLTSQAPEVVQAAIATTGVLRRSDDLPYLVQLLAEREHATAVRHAVAAYGDRAVDVLGAILRDDDEDPFRQRQSARVLGSIGSRQSSQPLLAYLRRSREVARPEVLRALTRIRTGAPHHRFNTEVVQLLLRSALRRFYQAASACAGMNDSVAGPASRFLLRAVRERQDRWLDEVFVLLGLIYPQREIKDAYYRIRSGRPDLRANALEFLDSSLVGSPIRPLLLPAIEERRSLAVLRAGRRLFELDEVPYPSVLRGLLENSDVWLQVCACHAAAESNLVDCKPKISQLAQHRNPLLRETAAAASARL